MKAASTMAINLEAMDQNPQAIPTLTDTPLGVPNTDVQHQAVSQKNANLVAALLLSMADAFVTSDLLLIMTVTLTGCLSGKMVAGVSFTRVIQ